MIQMKVTAQKGAMLVRFQAAVMSWNSGTEKEV